MFSLCLTIFLSYLSCSPAIIVSAFCCPAMAFLLMLLVCSMFLISGQESKWSLLLVMALCVYKIVTENTQNSSAMWARCCVYGKNERQKYGALLSRGLRRRHPLIRCPLVTYSTVSFYFMRNKSTWKLFANCCRAHHRCCDVGWGFWHWFWRVCSL